jgi:hypothetical protein
MSNSIADSVCMLKIDHCGVLFQESYMLVDCVEMLRRNDSDRDVVSALQVVSWLSFPMLFSR